MASIATGVVIVIVMVYFFLIYIFTVNFAADTSDSGSSSDDTRVDQQKISSSSEERAVRYRRRYSDSNYDVYDVAEEPSRRGDESEDEDCVYFLFPEASDCAAGEPRSTETRRRTDDRSF